MFVDARSLPADERLDADLCIVGAGAAGIVLAATLAGVGRRIILVESGDLTPDPATQDLYQGRSVGLPYSIIASRLRYFGGTTNHWQGACRALDAPDLAAREWVPHSGWPFPHAVLDPYYQRARPLCDLTPAPATVDDLRAAAGRPILWSGPLETAVWQMSPPTRFGEKYRAALDAAPGVTVLLNANLISLTAGADSGTVGLAGCGTLAGSRFAIAAGRYVLACGGIENARLLLLAARQGLVGLGEGAGLVGRFFMDHPEVPVGALVHDRPAADGDYWVGGPLGRFAEGFRLTEAAQQENRVANVGFFPLELTQVGRQAALEASFASPVQDLASRLAGAAPTGRRLVTLLRVTLEQSPDPDSRVTLADERDALGLSRVRLDWRLNDLDRHGLATAIAVIAREAGRQRIGRFRLSPALRAAGTGSGPPTVSLERLAEVLSYGCHHIGTTRMHDDPRRGVVDPDGRVHGLSNLYVAGSSIFPTAGLSNPTLTILAMTLRLADHLAAVR
jgi:choline dehydrogenase-like flavoprotein